MDSENEVIIVDDIIATNGLNGHSEDLNEMKTRSKASEVDALKAKMRSSVRSSAGGQDKAGSDTEMKKDSSKKVVEGKPAAAAGAAGAKDAFASATKSTSSSSSSSSSDTSAKASNANVLTAKKSTKATDELPLQQQPIVLLPAKKRNLDREDDSGINSRASSVSNLDDVTPRMRTRSSRTSDAIGGASTSTPAAKRFSQGRMPLSSYDFEDVTFDEDVSSPGSLKRKAVLYVEEMDDGDEVEKQQESEPVAKRPALAITTSFFNVFLNPLRALRGRFSKQPEVVAPATVAAAAAATTTTEETETISSTKTAKANAEDTIKENVSQSETSSDLSESTNASQTCRIM